MFIQSLSEVHHEFAQLWYAERVGLVGAVLLVQLVDEGIELLVGGLGHIFKGYFFWIIRREEEFQKLILYENTNKLASILNKPLIFPIIQNKTYHLDQSLASSIPPSVSIIVS